MIFKFEDYDTDLASRNLTKFYSQLMNSSVLNSSTSCIIQNERDLGLISSGLYKELGMQNFRPLKGFLLLPAEIEVFDGELVISNGVNVNDVRHKKIHLYEKGLIFHDNRTDSFNARAINSYNNRYWGLKPFETLLGVITRPNIGDDLESIFKLSFFGLGDEFISDQIEYLGKINKFRSNAKLYN